MSIAYTALSVQIDMAGYVIWIFLILLLKLVILIYICLKSEEIKKRRQNNQLTQAQRSTRQLVEETNQVSSRAENVTNTHNSVFVISSQNNSKQIRNGDTIIQDVPPSYESLFPPEVQSIQIKS